MTDKEAMKLALDALETLMIERGSIYEKAIAALKERLAQPEQEPVAHWSDCAVHSEPAYPKSECDCGGFPPQRTEQEPVECDGDFPEGFDKSLDIPAQALRQANAALCEVTNNRMWDVPALAERMLMFCRNTHPPQRKPLTNEQAYDLFGVHYNMSVIRNVEAAHGIKE